MQRQKKLLLVTSVLVGILAALAGTQVCWADEFGIGWASGDPDSFDPHQGEATTISGVVYHFSSSGDLAEPSMTAEIIDVVTLPVTVTLICQETPPEDPFAQLGEWSFSATWDGRDERGQIVSPGEYTYTVTLDLPNVGQDVRSGTVKVIIKD